MLAGAPSAERLLRAHRAGFSQLSQRQLEQLIAKDKRIVESEMRLKTALSLCNKLLSVNRDLLPQHQNQMPASKLPPLEKKGPKKSRPVVKKLHFDKIKSPPQFKDPATAMGLPSL